MLILKNEDILEIALDFRPKERTEIESREENAQRDSNMGMGDINFDLNQCRPMLWLLFEVEDSSFVLSRSMDSVYNRKFRHKYSGH